MASDNGLKVLRAVKYNNYHDGNQGEQKISQQIWSNCINSSDKPSGIEGKALAGVVSQLVQTGYLTTHGEGEDRCVALTRKGYEAVD